jgi:SAM-dependent methyltransferase
MMASVTTETHQEQDKEPGPRRRRVLTGVWRWLKAADLDLLGVPTGVLRRLEVVNLDQLGVKAGDRVLDIGCGVGRLMLRIGRRRCLATGIDLVRDDLREARRRLDEVWPQSELIEGDGGLLPFVDASFDFVTCTETLEHMADANLALREMARVLKPGGRLVVSVPDTLAELVGYHFSELYRRDPWGHKRIYTRGRIVRAVEAAGLQVYARRLRNSVDAVYWILFYLLDGWPLVRDWGVEAITRWQERSQEEPYSLFYHVLDQAGNRLLPKSIVVYAVKP